jgi:hypothetical protein
MAFSLINGKMKFRSKNEEIWPKINKKSQKKPQTGAL